MKNIKYNLIIAFTLVCFLQACSKVDFGDINDNPNASTIPVTSALLTNAQIALQGPVADTRAGTYCQYISETQYPEVSLYALPNPAWNGAYAGALYDFQNIININSSPETQGKEIGNGSNANQIAIARILKVYRYMYITDQYGAIPYSDALSGKAQPTYDSQESIYTSFFKELREASAQFDNGNPVLGDVIYNGDNSKWVKFANSLRIILALRISKANETIARTELADAISKPIFTDNSDNAVIGFPGGAFKNPWYNLYDGRNDFGISKTLVDVMVANNDKRLGAFGDLNASNTVKGVPYGLNRESVLEFTNANSDWSKVLSVGNRSENSPLVLLSAAHVFLARAEAAQRGFTSESVSNLYSEGLQNSWREWGVFDQSAFNTYINSSEVSLATNPLEKICTMRWISFFPNGNQGWAEWRRTGFPVLVPAVAATNSSKQIVRRFVYPVTESTLNKSSYSAAVSTINGGDSQDSKVWWDK